MCRFKNRTFMILDKAGSKAFNLTGATSVKGRIKGRIKAATPVTQ
jgi:hypothetical protein